MATGVLRHDTPHPTKLTHRHHQGKCAQAPTPINFVDPDFGAVASIGTVGDSYDNAMAESLNGLYKTECYNRQEFWADAREIELATSSWVAWYNSTRPHSSIGDRTPIEYEQAHYNGELPEPAEQPDNQMVNGPNERDTDRDINPRAYEHAG